jgi:membrane protease YdiL (CAAX protease family)
MLELHLDALYVNIKWVILLGGCLLCYLYFHFADHSVLFGRFFKPLALQHGSIRELSSKLGGLLWLGLVPLVFFSFMMPVVSLAWLRFAPSPAMFFWLAVLVPLPWILAWFTSRSEKHRLQYPQVREPVWTRRLLVVDLLCWALYLLGYEAFFRGFLLFGLAGSMDVWQAVMINTLFYSLAHIPKGVGEAAGAIPLGLLLCLITLTTGNFWVAFFVHLSMAWSNELMSLRNHTEIQSPIQRRLLWPS